MVYNVTFLKHIYCTN